MSPNDSMTVDEAIKEVQGFVASLPSRDGNGYVIHIPKTALAVLIAHAKSAPKEQIRAALERLRAKAKSTPKDKDGYPQCSKCHCRIFCMNLCELEDVELNGFATILTASLPPTEPTFTAGEVVKILREAWSSGQLIYLESMTTTAFEELIRTILGGE